MAARHYPPSLVEARLQARDLSGAIAAGWWGDEAAFSLVESGLGGRLMSVVLERGASSERVDLGLDLSNETGIATVAAIYPEGSAAREGCAYGLLCITRRLIIAHIASQVIRQVNGHLHFTCEAVVAAIKSCAAGPIRLSVVRPLALQSSCERVVRLGSGKHHAARFQPTVPCVLVYRFNVSSYDILFKVSIRREREEAREIESSSADDRPREVLLEVRSSGQSGELSLPPGLLSVEWSNAHSYVRSKELDFMLLLIPVSEFDTCKVSQQRERLLQSLSTCKQRSKQLKEIIRKTEAAIAIVRTEENRLIQTLTDATSRKVANSERLKQMKDELQQLDAANGLDQSSAEGYTFGR